MLSIAIAFTGHSKTSPCECLYAGHDADEALRVAKNPPPGFATVHVYKNLVPVKKCPVIPAEVQAPPVVLEVVEDAPVEETPPELLMEEKPAGKGRSK